MTTEEGEFVLKDRVKLYTKQWKVDPSVVPTAAIIWLHGFSDHCNAYYEFFPDLAKRGIIVFSYDQRGWGRSALVKKQWGVSGGTSVIFADLDEIITARLTYLETTYPDNPPPLYLGGHSMGGGNCLTYAYSGSLRSKLAGFVTFSPFLAFPPAQRPNGLLVAAGKLAANLLPNFQIVEHLDPTYMARDPDVCNDFKNDKLCHDTGTLVGISDMFDRGQKLLEKEFVCKFDKGKPVLILHGTGDKVADWKASKTFFELLEVEDKFYEQKDGWYHKMHADLKEERLPFADFVASWVIEKAEKLKKKAEEPPTANL